MAEGLEENTFPPSWAPRLPGMKEAELLMKRTARAAIERAERAMQALPDTE